MGTKTTGPLVPAAVIVGGLILLPVALIILGFDLVPLMAITAWSRGAWLVALGVVVLVAVAAVTIARSRNSA